MLNEGAVALKSNLMALLVLTAVVTVHEFGHLMAAVLQVRCVLLTSQLTETQSGGRWRAKPAAVALLTYSCHDTTHQPTHPPPPPTRASG